jgi:hypothetical protein
MWWDDRYLELTSSNVVPPPENLRTPGDRRLYAIHMRIKSDWFTLSPTWGKINGVINNDVTSTPAKTKFLMYSCPDTRTVIETSWTARPLLTGGKPIQGVEGINLHIPTHKVEKVKKKVRTPK